LTVGVDTSSENASLPLPPHLRGCWTRDFFNLESGFPRQQAWRQTRLDNASYSCASHDTGGLSVCPRVHTASILVSLAVKYVRLANRLESIRLSH
jgi:hypothetical protein